MSWINDALDNVGTFFNLPEMGLSESVGTDQLNKQGIKTANTGRVAYSAVPGIGTANTEAKFNDALSKVSRTTTPVTTQPQGNGGTGGQVLGDSTVTTAPASGGAALPALNQAAINNTQVAIDQLPALLRAALEAEATRYGNLTRAFNDQETNQRGVYDESTTTNQQNYDANYMDSIRAGIKGLGGLMNILRGTGAAGGTAQDLVRDTVGGITSADIRTGADTQKANQTALDSSLSQFLTELKGKRQNAEDTRVNNERAINRDNLSQMQDLYSKMAGYYSDAGRTGEATNFMNRAGGLTPQIAQNSMAKQSAYDTTPVAVKAPTLTAFAEPTQPDVAVAPESGQVGTGIFTMNRKKEQVQQPVALPVGF